MTRVKIGTSLVKLMEVEERIPFDPEGSIESIIIALTNITKREEYIEGRVDFEDEQDWRDTYRVWYVYMKRLETEKEAEKRITKAAKSRLKKKARKLEHDSKKKEKDRKEYERLKELFDEHGGLDGN